MRVGPALGRLRGIQQIQPEQLELHGAAGKPAAAVLGYAWAFATIWPAIFETADLVSCLRDGERPPTAISGRTNAGSRSARSVWLSIAAGAADAGRPVPGVEPDRDVYGGAGVARLHLPARSAQCRAGS